MRERVRDKLRGVSPRANAFAIFFVCALTTIIMDRALKLWVPEGQEGPFLVRVLQQVRDMLSWIRTDLLLTAAATAFFLYAWEERATWRAGLRGALRKLRARWVARTTAHAIASPKPASLMTYIKCDADGSILDGSNVTAVTDNGDREFTVHFGEPLDTGSLVVLPVGETPAPKVSNVTSQSVTLKLPESRPFKFRFDANPASSEALRRMEVSSAMPSQRPSYQAEQKLKVIDSALAILRDDIPPVLHRTAQLEGRAWNSFKHENTAYATELTDCRDRARQVFKSLEDRRQRHPEYRDIGDALQQPPEGHTIESALGNFLVTWQAIFTYLKPETPAEAFNHLMGPRVLDVNLTREKMERWRNEAERKLIELHRKVSA